MFEMKMTISAAELAAAINNLAQAIEGSKTSPVCIDLAEPVTGAAPGVAQESAPTSTETVQEEVLYDPNESTLPWEEKTADTPQTVKKAAPAPDRKAVRHMVVTKIQDGRRDEVKALVAKYSPTEKLDQIPEDKMADFVSELEVL